MELVPTENQAMVVRTIVAGKADIQAYANAVLAEAQTEATHWRLSLEEAERGVVAASAAQEPDQLARWRSQRTRRLHRLERADRFLKAVEAGYLPMPRIPTRRIDWTDKLIPPECLESLAAAKASGLFEHFSIADGSDITGWSGRSSRGRDPILFGVIGTELFPLAWWR
jgi:hypothetical protein